MSTPLVQQQSLCMLLLYFFALWHNDPSFRPFVFVFAFTIMLSTNRICFGTANRVDSDANLFTLKADTQTRRALRHNHNKRPLVGTCAGVCAYVRHAVAMLCLSLQHHTKSSVILVFSPVLFSFFYFRFSHCFLSDFFSPIGMLNLS